MIALNKFDCFLLNLGQKKHDFNSDVFKVLFLSAHADPSLDALKADVSEIAASGGYPAGGLPLSVLSFTQTAGVARLITNNPSITTSGLVGPVWGMAIYNDTTSGDPLLFYANFATGITLPSGITWPIGLDTDNGIWWGS